MNIKLKIIDKNFYNEFPLPKYETIGAAGLDLRANLGPLLSSTIETNCVCIPPKETILVPTGLAIHIDDSSIVAVVCPRSGLGHKHGIVLGNTIGIVDSDYQGELMVSLHNRTNNPFDVCHGDRIAQLLFFPVIQVSFDVVDNFTSTNRGTGGFESTGRK
jgi:dUTP pyrophosphatase